MFKFTYHLVLNFAPSETLHLLFPLPGTLPSLPSFILQVEILFFRKAFHE